MRKGERGRGGERPRRGVREERVREGECGGDQDREEGIIVVLLSPRRRWHVVVLSPLACRHCLVLVVCPVVVVSVIVLLPCGFLILAGACPSSSVSVYV